MNSTEFVTSLIKQKYKSIRQFSIETGIPYTTIKSGLLKGIGGMAVDTIIKMCDALDIKVDDLMKTQEDPSPQNPEEKELLEIYQKAKQSDRADVKALLRAVDRLLKIDE